MISTNKIKSLLIFIYNVWEIIQPTLFQSIYLSMFYFFFSLLLLPCLFIIKLNCFTLFILLHNIFYDYYLFNECRFNIQIIVTKVNSFFLRICKNRQKKTLKRKTRDLPEWLQVHRELIHKFFISVRCECFHLRTKLVFIMNDDFHRNSLFL